MRTMWVKLVVVGLAVALVSPALAQRPRQPGGRGLGRNVPVLAMPQVQEELKLSAGQKEKIGKAMEEVTGKFREDLRKAREAGDRAKLRELGQKSGEALTKALEPIKKGLEPEQQKRLHQIELQMMGARAYRDPVVQKALALKPDQKETINSVLEDLQKETQKLRGEGFTRETAQQIRQLNQKAQEKITGTLTDEQKASFKEMLGKPFERRRPGAGRPDF